MTPFKPVFYFLWFFLCTPILPSAYCKAPQCLGRMPCCQPRPEHTLLLSWAHSAPFLRSWIQADLHLWGSSSSSQSLLMSKHNLEDSVWKRTCTSILTLPASLCPISYFDLHRLFPSQMALSYPASSHMVCNPSQHFTLKTIVLHLKTFMLLALTNTHQRFLDISCYSGILLVAMVGSSPTRPIKAPVWKSVTWCGFY